MGLALMTGQQKSITIITEWHYDQVLDRCSHLSDIKHTVKMNAKIFTSIISYYMYLFEITVKRSPFDNCLHWKFCLVSLPGSSNQFGNNVLLFDYFPMLFYCHLENPKMWSTNSSKSCKFCAHILSILHYGQGWPCLPKVISDVTSHRAKFWNFTLKMSASTQIWIGWTSH